MRDPDPALGFRDFLEKRRLVEVMVRFARWLKSFSKSKSIWEAMIDKVRVNWDSVFPGS